MQISMPPPVDVSNPICTPATVGATGFPFVPVNDPALQFKCPTAVIVPFVEMLPADPGTPMT